MDDQAETLKALELFCSTFDEARASESKENGTPEGESSGFARITVPEILDKYIVNVAKTGQTGFPWQSVQPLFLCKLDEVIRRYNSKDPYDKIPRLPNCKLNSFKDIYSSIIKSAELFSHAPFTIQRLCELIVEPEKHYKRIDKFMRALEKNLQIVTTVSKEGSKLSTHDQEEQETESAYIGPMRISKRQKLAKPAIDWFNTTITEETVFEGQGAFGDGLSNEEPDARMEESGFTVENVSERPVEVAPISAKRPREEDTDSANTKRVKVVSEVTSAEEVSMEEESVDVETRSEDAENKPPPAVKETAKETTEEVVKETADETASNDCPISDPAAAEVSVDTKQADEGVMELKEVTESTSSDSVMDSSVESVTGSSDEPFLSLSTEDNSLTEELPEEIKLETVTEQPTQVSEEVTKESTDPVMVEEKTTPESTADTVSQESVTENTQNAAPKTD